MNPRRLTFSTRQIATTGQSLGNCAQAFTQLAHDLQSGNLSAAQQDFTTLQQDAQQKPSQQVGGHHHHHHQTESSQAASSSSSSQQTNPINQAFGQLEQTLQAGNLQGAQSAFSTLQNDLQQIGGFITSGSSNTGAPAATSGLNVQA